MIWIDKFHLESSIEGICTQVSHEAAEIDPTGWKIKSQNKLVEELIKTRSVFGLPKYEEEIKEDQHHLPRIRNRSNLTNNLNGKVSLL